MVPTVRVSTGNFTREKAHELRWEAQLALFGPNQKGAVILYNFTISSTSRNFACAKFANKAGKYFLKENGQLTVVQSRRAVLSIQCASAIT